MSPGHLRIVVITGATGSIGQKVRTHLESLGGFELRMLDVNPSKDPKVISADLSEYDEAWARQFEGADAVVHLAGASSTMASWEVVQKLNIDLSLNVFRAAERHGTHRIVFASSNWVVAGHRFSDRRLTPEMPPWPINPYGCSKLAIERAGIALAAHTGISFIALRIGYAQHTAGNLPGPHMEHGIWGQQMWLSDRDLCNATERAVLAPNVSCAVLNLMSDNPGMRWDIDATRQVIGYQPQDGHAAIETTEGDERERFTRAGWEVTERLQWMTGKW